MEKGPKGNMHLASLYIHHTMADVELVGKIPRPGEGAWSRIAASDAELGRLEHY